MITRSVFQQILLGLALIELAYSDDAWKSLPKTKIEDSINSKIEAHPDLVYARYGDRELKLDLFRPKDAEENLPAIVCIHGGAWWKGNRLNHGHIARAIAARGYVTVSISYRLSGEQAFPAQIQDAKAAVRWLRANAEKWGINSDKIGATGSSAGGHLTALLATSGGIKTLEGEGGNPTFSSRIQAAVPMGAQSDLESERIRLRSKDPKAAFYPQFLGGTQEEVPKNYQKASPKHYINRDDPPMFFLTGELDDPSTHGVETRKELTELQIPTGLFVIPEAPHGFLTKQKFFDIAIDQIDRFFSVYLKK